MLLPLPAVTIHLCTPDSPPVFLRESGGLGEGAVKSSYISLHTAPGCLTAQSLFFVERRVRAWCRHLLSREDPGETRAPGMSPRALTCCPLPGVRWQGGVFAGKTSPPGPVGGVPCTEHEISVIRHGMKVAGGLLR